MTTHEILVIVLMSISLVVTIMTLIVNILLEYIKHAKYNHL